MSASSGLSSKGEKQKAKFQSLDINKIYKSNRGENSEKAQQKSIKTYNHGMQILGKVPSTRRAPANLPSLKSEHNGTEAAVPLVPPGGPGWGKQDSNNAPNGLPAGKIDSNQISNPPPHQSLPASQIVIPKQEHPHVPNASNDKSWSSVMSRGDPHSNHPPPFQGPQFQHDFPSLSSGSDIGQGRNGGQEAAYHSGLSLRPQTEGSWIGGGSGTGADGKPISAHLNAPPQLLAQAGLAQQQQQTLPAQYRGVMPPFMYKNSSPPTNATSNQISTQIPQSHENIGRHDKPVFNPKGYTDASLPSIIKEEELSRMDEIERDMGWAYTDDIDYNKKLSFSDDELPHDKIHKSKQNYKKNFERSEMSKREISDSWQATNKEHSSEEEDFKIKRSQHSKEVEIAVQRAKQRKKDEEKRFNEATKQGAQQKLKELEEKINKRDREGDEGVGTINPSIVPPKPIAPTEIPLPDFQKEKETHNFKEIEESSKISNEKHEDKMEKPSNMFKQLTEIEGKTSFRRNTKTQERDNRKQGAPTFSRQFESDLPPRFQRQHNQQNIQPQFNDHFDNRTSLTQNYSKNNFRNLLINNPTNESKKPIMEDSVKISYPTSEVTHKLDSPYITDSCNSNYEYDDNKFIKDEKIEERGNKNEFDKKDYERRDYIPAKKRNENVSSDNKTKKNRNQDNLYDRFQRLDSQETKLSKYSDMREYNSWSESKFESYEERRREDRRQVPGPITRDRIEADDFNESRNLTSLKRGQIPEKKSIESRNKDNKYNDNSENKDLEHSDSKTWSENSDKSKSLIKKDEKDKSVDNNKRNMKNEDYREKDDKRNLSNRNKTYSQNKVWNNDYHHRPVGDRGGWMKKTNPSNKNPKINSGHKLDVIGTDSEGSSEEHHMIKEEKHLKSDKDKISKNHSSKDDRRNLKSDKDKQNDKNQDPKRDNYVPRGEPSRHGRGGSNFRSRVGLSKRIDGYGPPSSKSPFSHNDDRKSIDNETDVNVSKKSDKNIHYDNRDQDKNFTSEIKHFDDNKNRGHKNIIGSKPVSNSNTSRKPNPPIRSVNDKKNLPTKIDETHSKQNKTDESNILCNAIADITLKSKDELHDEFEEEEIISSDADGFQEVKSRKTTKDRPKVEEKPLSSFPGKTIVSDTKEKSKKPHQPVQQPTHNIPPLMATLVNPPHVLPQTNKNQYDRQNRQNKIPPRFAKLRESNRLQKMQQQHGMVDMSDIKSGQCRNMFNSKISVSSNNTVSPLANAWDKPLSNQLRPMDSENILGSNLDNASGNNTHSPPGDADNKKINKPANISETAILDGTTPPVNTIIFENTNFKSGPSNRNNIRNDKMRKEEISLDNTSLSNFSKPISDLLGKNEKQSDSIQLQLPFKEDSGDMKLDFFDSDLTLSDEKSLKNSCLTRTMHSISSGGNNISTADALNFKIQSVKKVWETPTEHSGPQDDANNSFTSFAPDPNTLDSSSFVKANENMEDNQEQHGYNPSSNQQTSNNTTNVCKVKPTQQVAGASNQTVSNTGGGHAVHSGMMAPGLMGNPLSPPPIQPVIGGLGQPPQQYPTNQHIGYQTGLGNNNQYGMSTIPSPPTVLPYTAQPMQAQTANLYGTFQIDQTGVLGGQGRSQYSQYPNHFSLGQAASSPYSQSMFLQTAQGHPPPTPQTPEIYQNINNYRLSTGPFGQNQQLNNPTTVLIPSTSNSLMSASVKPSTQQISAIGTKSGSVGQAYQQQSQQGQQMFMFDPTIQANFIQGAGVLQRPTGPVQNNVVPTLHSSSSYYSGSTGTAKQFNCTWRF